LDTDTLIFSVKAACQVSRGDEVSVDRKAEKDINEVTSVECEGAKTEDVEVLFKALDCDGDGFLSKDEFENALNLIKLFSKEEADDLFIKADHDCDGKIGLDDFLRFVRKYK
jgi:Ca2+-binding EF-hand superfamily protein